MQILAPCTRLEFPIRITFPPGTHPCWVQALTALPVPGLEKGRPKELQRTFWICLELDLIQGDPLEMREWGTHPAGNSKAVGNCCSMAQEGALPANNEKNNYVHC